MEQQLTDAQEEFFVRIFPTGIFPVVPLVVGI